MYQLSTPLSQVTGIGPQRLTALTTAGLTTVQDLLLWVPLRYEDRSQLVTTATAPLNELVTLEAEVVKASQRFVGRRSFQTATIKDATGQLSVRWFNNKFVMAKLQPGTRWLFSGKLNDRRTLMQPVVEAATADTIHTGRLVPIYSSLSGFKAGSLRRLLKHVIDQLDPELDDPVVQATANNLMSLADTFTQLHFPDTEARVISARERLALEELLSLMRHAQHLKQYWHDLPPALASPAVNPNNWNHALSQLPFSLTNGQQQAISEISRDLAGTQPMNRLLVGDVGSGKTVVAGLAAWQVIRAGGTVGLVAPTQILAQQHVQTLSRLFPDLQIELITGQRKTPSDRPPQLWVGTQAILNRLTLLKPSLLIFDEQHRFGVSQRSAISFGQQTPHILTMSATPIPRTLMLTIFAHLQLSTLSELPAGRLPTKSWVIPDSKRAASLEWMADQIRLGHQENQPRQVLWVCPFIDPSQSAALENVAAAKDTFASLAAQLQPLGVRAGLLHGRQSKAEQAKVIESLREHQLDLVVTTPIVEVGVDLPAASIMVIEAAERFGLASLHQLRGRVGRAGQQGYCLLFTTSKSAETQQRLHQFCDSTNGSELAELDLHHRGAGDLFGTAQHGFDQLRFATWTDFELISQARQLFEKLPTDNSWRSLFDHASPQNPNLPLAN